MDEKSKIELLKELIEQNRFIALYDFMKSESDNIVDKLSSPKYLGLKELLDSKTVGEIIESYETEIFYLIEALTILCKFRKGDHYDIINEIVDKFIYMKKNENDKYGYIWRQLCNYPLLLIVYCLGISFLKNNNIKDLYLILNKNIDDDNLDFEEKESTKYFLFEKINSYHIFNEASNRSVDIFKYVTVPDSVKNRTQNDLHQRLNVNIRIFEYLSNLMSPYFRDKNEFLNYFDLYEYFIGLIFIDRRIVNKWGIFAPYGMRYWQFNSYGMFSLSKNKLIYEFANDISKNKNDVIKAGFFDSNLERFQFALKEYNKFLSQLR